MHIDRYDFGHIDIEGHGYDADVVIFPDYVQARWWRREGHRLAPEDLESVLAETPEVLVVGTGYFGRMRVPEQTLASLRSAGVDVRVEKTGEAADSRSPRMWRPRRPARRWTGAQPATRPTGSPCASASALKRSSVG